MFSLRSERSVIFIERGSGVNRKAYALVAAMFLASGLTVALDVGPTSSPLNLESALATDPHEDPLFTQDISAWTYSSEFAERFKRLKMKEPGPTGAHAVNFQVHQAEELDRCVFNVFLDNALPIDYPEGPVGFLSFTYPMSWFFLKLSPEDREEVETAYLRKYRESRAFLTHAGGEDPLTYFQNRTNLYRDVMVVTLTFRCDLVAAWKNPLRLRLRTTTGAFQEIDLPDHYLGWINATLTKWRRPDAKLMEEGLADHNVWSYTSEFAMRFGLPLLNEPGPTGAQAVAWRVEANQTFNDESLCLLDVYVDDTVPLLFPETDIGFASLRPGLPYFLIPKDKSDRNALHSSYSVYGNTELFFIRELSEKEQKRFPHKEHIERNLFRVINRSPFTFSQYRKHALPGVSYIAFNIGCMTPPTGELGPVGISIIKTDRAKHQILLPAQFLSRMSHDWRVRHDIPRKCKHPKFYRHENCEKRLN